MMQPIFRSFRLKFHVFFPPIPYALQRTSVKRRLKINSVVVDARALCYFHPVLLNIRHQPQILCLFTFNSPLFCPVVCLPSFLAPLLTQMSVHFLNWHCVKQQSLPTQISFILILHTVAAKQGDLVGKAN